MRAVLPTLVLASMIILSGAARAQSADEDRLRELVDLAVRLPVSPWDNPNLYELEGLFRGYPQTALAALDTVTATANFDLNVEANFLKIEAAADLLGAIPDPSAISRLETLYSRASDSSGGNAPRLRLCVVNALGNNPIRVTHPLLRQFPQAAADALRRWVITETNREILVCVLWGFTIQVQNLDPVVIGQLRTKIGDYDVDVALRARQLNLNPDNVSRFDGSIAWIDELLSSIENGGPALGDYDEGSSHILNAVCNGVTSTANSPSSAAAIRSRIARAHVIRSQLRTKIDTVPRPPQHAVAIPQIGNVQTLINGLIEALEEAQVALTPEEQAWLKRLRGN